MEQKMGIIVTVYIYLRERLGPDIYESRRVWGLYRLDSAMVMLV